MFSLERVCLRFKEHCPLNTVCPDISNLNRAIVSSFIAETSLPQDNEQHFTGSGWCCYMISDAGERLVKKNMHFRGWESRFRNECLPCNELKKYQNQSYPIFLGESFSDLPSQYDCKAHPHHIGVQCITYTLRTNTLLSST